jgi:hypothetical protein
MAITTILRMPARLTDTTALNGSAAGSLSAQAPGTTEAGAEATTVAADTTDGAGITDVVAITAVADTTVATGFMDVKATDGKVTNAAGTSVASPGEATAEADPEVAIAAADIEVAVPEGVAATTAAVRTEAVATVAAVRTVGVRMVVDTGKKLQNGLSKWQRYRCHFFCLPILQTACSVYQVR